MDYIVYFVMFAGTITISVDKTVADMDIKLKPQAEKLTISIDSVAAQIPPQIAYFIPDQLFNGTNFGNPNSNPNDPTIINMWPPNTFRNSSNGRNSTFQWNITDMVMSSQRPIRYFAVPRHQDMGDSETALQNYDYQVDFAKLPDKKPDFHRFEQLYRKRKPVKSSGKLKKKKHSKRPISHSSEPLYNYANNSPNVRDRVKVIKMNLENKFGNSKEDEPQSVSNDSSEEYEGEMIDRFKFLKTNGKSKKNRNKNHHHRNDKDRIVMTKLSQPQSSVENESNQFYYDNSNNESNENGSDRSDYNTDHENCDDRQHRHKHNHRANLVKQQQSDDQDYETDVQQIPSARDPRKGYSIYLTKVTKRPLRVDRTQNARIHFVPTRMLSTVRGTKVLVRKPRKNKNPYRGKVSESGGHMVYTEDGFEDANYDHGTHHKNHEYLKRKRRATNYDKLRGQELIDHLETLIRNVSDYLNSSEIVPNTDKKYPLYNSSNENIGNSVIKYSEYAKPVVDNKHSSELYESKTKECEEIEEPDFSNAGNYNDTNQPKKRLGKLGDNLKCLKEKLFGSDPLDNPLFNEENITEPKAKNVLGSSVNAADGISVVYTDVMDNIKKNAFNENQRIFSNYGVTENFAVGTINTQHKPDIDDELNTSEQYPEIPVRSKYSAVYKKFAQVSESPLTAFNVFNNPAQVPILDISKFIPTPNYPTDDDFHETDFRPIVSPYHIQTEPSTTSTTTKAPTTKKVIPERVQGKRPLQFHYETLNSNVHLNYIPPNFNPNIQRLKPNSNRKYQNPNINPNVKFNSVGHVITANLVHQNVNRNQSPPAANIKIIRRRLPAQIVRVFPPKL